MSLNVLNRFQGTQGFIHATTKGQVVDSGVLNDAIFVDDKQPAQRNTSIGIEDVVSCADFFLDIRHQRIVQVTDASRFAIGLNPREVREFAVYRNTKNFGVDGFEFIVAIAKDTSSG